LHIFGNRQNDINEINLFLCIARVPNANRIGVIQYIAKHLKLDLNPWTNQYDQMLSEKDKKILFTFSNKNILNFRMAIDFLEQQAKYLIYLFFYKKNTNIKNLEKYKNQKIIDYFFNEKKHNKYFLLLKKEILIPIINSSYNEKLSFINSLNGQYVKSGPSGAPTRGKTEALPTVWEEKDAFNALMTKASEDMIKLTSVIEDADDIRGTLKQFMWSNCKACHSRYREEH